MITADKMRKLAFLDTVSLEQALKKNYPEDHAITSRFIGITNGGQFCYEIGYQDIDLAGQGLTFCKFFVNLDEKEELVAEY